MRRALAAFLALAISPIPGVAQGTSTQTVNPNVTPPPPPQEKPDKPSRARLRSITDLVLIDAQVTDRSGKPLKGLTKEQFSILEDGKPQSLASFEYSDVETMETAGTPEAQPLLVALGTPPESDAQRQAIRDRRLIVLFFDLTSLDPPDLLRSAAAALRFVGEQMTPADLVAVVAYGNRLKINANFTNDRIALSRVISRLRPGLEAQLAGLATAVAQEGQDTADEDSGDAFIPDETEFNIFNTDRKLAALESLAQLLKETPGRKSVISFTSGIAQTGQENRTQLRATTDAANRSNVSFYTVDSTGLQAVSPGGDASSAGAGGTAQYSGAAVFRQVGDRQYSRETLATLATDTGGRSFFDLGDFREVFQQVEHDASGYYLLGYYSTNAKADGRWRRVEVRVRAPSARVRYRPGYYALRNYGQLTTEDRERQLDEALHADNPRVELALAVETAQFRVGRDEIFVPIAAKLSSSALQWAQRRGRHEAEFDFAAEVREESSGHPVAALRDTIKVQLDPERFREVQQRPLVYQGGIILGPGSYRLKFLARENETGRIGTFEEPLRLSPAQPERLELSSLLLSSQVQEVRSSGEVQKKALGSDAKLRHSPLEVSGERIVPSVTRVFSSNQTLYALFQAYIPAKADAAKVRAGLVFFRDGTRSSETPLLEPAEWNAKTRTAAFRLAVPLEKLGPGRYTVRAVVVEAGGSFAGFAGQSFAVRALTASVPGGSSGATSSVSGPSPRP